MSSSAEEAGGCGRPLLLVLPLCAFLTAWAAHCGWSMAQ